MAAVAQTALECETERWLPGGRAEARMSVHLQLRCVMNLIQNRKGTLSRYRWQQPLQMSDGGAFGFEQ
jgi:hypothetical protein